MSPAQIIRRWIIAAGLAPVSQSDPWASFTGFLPDTPDSSMAIYDTAGTSDGRLMSGERIEHPGIQVRVRSRDYGAAHTKISAIAAAFDEAGGDFITIEAITYQINNISRTSNILTSGIEEEGDRKRFNFTFNAILTMRKVT